MKRILVIAMILTLLVCIGCGQAPVVGEVSTAVPVTPAPTATSAPTTVPTPSPTPEPSSEPGIVLVDGAGILYTYFERGVSVSITGEDEGYYTTSLDGVDVRVEKWLVRMNMETEPEEWTGYAKRGTEVYESAYLEGEALASLNLNTAVTVIDEVGDRLYIEWDGQRGYVLAEQISKKKISTGGGGVGGADGGDIVLGFRYGGELPVSLSAVYSELEEPMPFAPGMGTILSDKTEAYLLLMKRGDTVKVTGVDGDVYSILTNGQIGTIPKRLVQLASEDAFEPWDGYTRLKAPLYGHYRLIGQAEELKVNTVVSVVADLEDCYMVELDGAVGFIPVTEVSAEKIKTGGGGGGGGGEWTDPVL